jgi:hypothetical protein
MKYLYGVYCQLLILSGQQAMAQNKRCAIFWHGLFEQERSFADLSIYIEEEKALQIWWFLKEDNQLLRQKWRMVSNHQQRIGQYRIYIEKRKEPG